MTLNHVIYVRVVASEQSNMNAIVYILLSLKDKKTYVGFTTNLNRRITEHNLGKVKATKYRRPFILLYTEKFDTQTEAKKREVYYKSSIGRKKLKQFFTGSPLILK